MIPASRSIEASWQQLEGLSAASLSRLQTYVDLLGSWQETHNLVSRSSLQEVWTRHVADSLQLLELAPEGFRSWVDLGSGAGFPGLVVAIVSKPHPDRRFWLVEANLKKAAFLRTVVRQTRAPACVEPERIEEFTARFRAAADVVSARALASVAKVCSLAAPLMATDTVLLLPKGREFGSELQDAAKSWLFDVVSTPSVTDSQARILAIRNLRPRVPP